MSKMPRKSWNSDKCAIDGCSSTAKNNSDLSFHVFPLPNTRFIYRPGDVPGKVEKTDMREVWKGLTGVVNIKPKKTKICSLHFTKSDYLFGDFSEAVTRRTLKKNAVPSRSLPVLNNSIYKSLISLIQEENQRNLFEKSDEPAESILKVQANRVCMLSKCIKSEKDLQISTGIQSFEILTAIVKMMGGIFVKESEIITSKNRVLLAFVKLKQNLDYNFLAILFNLSGAEQCEQIFYSTLQVLSNSLKASISLPLYEKMSTDWPAYLSEIKIVLDSMDIYMEGRDASYKIIIGSSLGGLISYISEPYDEDGSYTDIFRESNLTKLLKPGDGIMVNDEFTFEEVCSINGWKCTRPKSLAERIYLDRFDEKIKSFGIVSTVIPDRIVPVVEDVFIVICGLINMNAFSRSIPILEIDSA